MTTTMTIVVLTSNSILGFISFTPQQSKYIPTLPAPWKTWKYQCGGCSIVLLDQELLFYVFSTVSKFWFPNSRPNPASSLSIALLNRLPLMCLHFLNNKTLSWLRCRSARLTTMGKKWVQLFFFNIEGGAAILAGRSHPQSDRVRHGISTPTALCKELARLKWWRILTVLYIISLPSW